MVMNVELQATCSALGYLEGKKYIKEPDCLETVKDLIRFLKREDETCDIRRQLGHAGIVQNDLLQLIKHYKDDLVLFDTVLRLLVNLTQPAYLCFNNHIPDDKTLRNYYLEIESHLYNYKEAFVDEELFAVLTEKLGNILKLDWEHRQEEDKLTLERLLILLRNILHIAPDPFTEKRTDDDASLHDQIIWVFHVSGMEDMLLYIASADDERQLCMHILEIISLMFREQKPEILACAGVKKSQAEKENEERELELIREKERAKRRAEFLKQSTRHSRFGGTYVVKNMKSISEREMIYHKAHGDVDAITLNDKKRRTKISKNRAPIKNTEVSRRSTLSIRLCLKEFCIQFLENCYNPLLFAVKDNLVREKTQEHDETYYLWSMRFFMEFCRLHSKRVELVSETMSTNVFHYIYTNLVTYYEMMITEKKEAKVWGRRAHLALKAYQELMLTLDSMDRSGNPQYMESSKVIKSNLFYMMEYRDIFVTLLRRFNEGQMSRAYLKDLVESSHLFLKMLEAWSKRGNVVVQKKKTKKKNKKVKENKNKETSGPNELELESMWDEVSSELSAMIQGREEIPTDVAPFDAASEVDVDQQRADAMIRIQDTLRDKKPGEAMAIFRAAREVWPERNEFGSADISPEEEFMALRAIFLAPIPRPAQESEEVEHEEQEEGFNEVEEEEMESVAVASEQEFDFKIYLNTFAKPTIMKSYSLLLADYQTNSLHTNHCIIKMFYRVAVELGYIGMLFQASIFRIFQLLMYGPYYKLPRYKEMVKFGTYLVHHFVKASEGNPKIFMEMLFWKSSVDGMDLVHGYGYSTNNKNKVLWTEEQEQEVGRLYEEAVADVEPGKDVADKIMERLTDPTKTRNQLIRQLKRQNLIENASELNNKKKYNTAPWREEEELALRNLFDRYKDDDDPIGNIMNSDSMNRAKNHIIRKLMELDLIQDRREVDKQRKSKPKQPVTWLEEEELQLRSLFDEHRNTEEPLRGIMLSVVGKKKSQVVDKLLELELINHRSEVEKIKVKKKTTTNTNVWGNYGQDEVLPDFSSSDEETRQRRLNCKSSLLNKAHKSNLEAEGRSGSGSGSESDSKSSSDSKDEKSSEDEDDQETMPRSDSSMHDVITNIVDNGYRDQIKWLQTALKRTATNREKNNSCVSIPVVPLTEDNENAMEDKKFLDFMRKIGFAPPANEQEAFWRIPGDLTPIELRNIVEGLELDEDGKPVRADKIPVVKQQKDKSAKKSDNKQRKVEQMKKKKQEKERQSKEKKEQAEKKKKLKSKLEALKALKESRKRKRNTASNDSESSDDEDVSRRKVSPSNKRKTRKIQKMVNSSSESESRVKNGDISGSEKDEVSQTTDKRSTSRIIESDSDSHDIPNTNKNVDENDNDMTNTDYSLRLQLDSDDDMASETVNNNKSILKSDTSDDDDQPLINNKPSESFPATMLTQGIGSDSEVDDHVPLRKVLKKKIISSDED